MTLNTVKEPVNLCRAKVELEDLFEALNLPSETHVYVRLSGRRVPIQELEVDWLEIDGQKPLFSELRPEESQAPVQQHELETALEPWKQTFTCKHPTRCHGNRQVLGRGPFHSHLKWHVSMGDKIKDCGADAVQVLEKFAEKRRGRVGKRPVGRPRKVKT